MKKESFKNQLRIEVEKICKLKNQDFNTSKHRGMAFEDWCFDFFSLKYPTADNKSDDSIIRTDDGENDIIFRSDDTKEAFIIQAKYPLPKQENDIPEREVKSFFSNFELFKETNFSKKRDPKNHRLADLTNEIKFWIKENYNINYIFISTDRKHSKVSAVEDEYNSKFKKTELNVQFQVWGLAELLEEYNEVTKIDESYPEEIPFTIADHHFMMPESSSKDSVRNITFAIKGTELQNIAKKHKESLFNWNIRRFLGKKGDVNKGLEDTIINQPQNFYYYNNGISALCEDFDFNEKTKQLRIKRLQIVNGAQTVGALKAADPDNLKNVLVLEN